MQSLTYTESALTESWADFKARRAQERERARTARPAVIRRLSQPKRERRAQAATAPVGRSREIIAAVSARHGLRPADLTGSRGKPAVIVARWQAMWEVRQSTKLSLPAIGRIFGGRDHTTVLHGIRAHAKRMAEAAQ